MSTARTVTISALIGAAVVFAVGWAWANITRILLGIALLIVTAIVIAPFINDDTNYSERQVIVANTSRIITEFDSSRNLTGVTLQNGSRFLLKDVTMTCGSESMTVDKIAPRHSAHFDMFVDRNHYAPCGFTYTAVEVRKPRSQNSSFSEGMEP